ncbi:MAG: BamA/TamA family outer membrane protein, partial [Gemmobacter sp.]|nr:BamA/TamA family outer membrane protein [Gemmobacter sp.]
KLELRYTLSKNRMYNVDAATSSPILVREEATGALVSSAIGYSYSWDNRRNGLGGNNVYVFRFAQDFGGVGGDMKFVRTEALAVAETKILNEEVTLRAQLEGGVIATSGANSTRVTERFFMDGKIRGFEPFGLGPRDLGSTNQDALGGNMFAVARLEAEFPIGLPEEYGVKGGLFFDVGSVWGLDDTAGINLAGSDKLELRSSIGASIFWDTPIGPLRFNFAKAIKKQAYDKEQVFDLTISTKF